MKRMLSGLLIIGLTFRGCILIIKSHHWAENAKFYFRDYLSCEEVYNDQ